MMRRQLAGTRPIMAGIHAGRLRIRRKGRKVRLLNPIKAHRCMGKATVRTTAVQTALPNGLLTALPMRSLLAVAMTHWQ
jgi:hypothetical protein